MTRMTGAYRQMFAMEVKLQYPRVLSQHQGGPTFRPPSADLLSVKVASIGLARFTLVDFIRVRVI